MKLIQYDIRQHIKLKYVKWDGKVIYRDLSLFNIISTPIISFDFTSISPLSKPEGELFYIDYEYGNK